MTLSYSLLSYQDCLEAMDQAMADEQGGRVRFNDRSSALHFRARCHQARMITREKNKKIHPDPEHPQHGACIYDVLVLRERHSEPYWYIYLEKMTANMIEVEPLSGAKQIEHKPMKLIAAPASPPANNEFKRRL